MKTCLSIRIPEELWITIIGNNGLILQQLFTVNKQINMYLEKIKKEFIRYTQIYDYNRNYITKNISLITIIKCDNNICNIKYNNNQYTLNMDFYNNINFQLYNDLKVLMIYNLDIIKYAVYKNILYDMENYTIPPGILNETCDSIHKLINLVCDQASSGKDIAKFSLIYHKFDIVNAILFMPSYY